MRHTTISTVMLVCLAFSISHAQSSYSIANKFPLAGDGGWDYITMDEANGRVFVSHANTIQVIDATNGKLLGTVPDTKGVHGITLALDLGKGFISDGRDTTVTVIDLNTFAVQAHITVTGANPDAILYEPTTHRVFTFNGRSSNATVIDAKTNSILGTIALEGKPEFAVADGKGHMFVNIEDKNLICAIDPKTMKVTQHWPIAPGDEPSGLAIDAESNRLFAVCSNKLMVVVDAQIGKVITTLPIGEHVDGVAFDSKLKRAYSSNGEGTMTVVQEENPNKYSVLQTVKTKQGARTICVDSKTHHCYLPTADYGPMPAATMEKPHPRPPVLPGTFVVLDIAVK